MRDPLAGRADRGTRRTLPVPGDATFHPAHGIEGRDGGTTRNPYDGSLGGPWGEARHRAGPGIFGARTRQLTPQARRKETFRVSALSGPA
ncbi:hypothetical protein JCM9533A_17150 [Catenuloplanes niger JCM 9533]